ncbi:T9SS type A sorting domain-containing protein [Dyadobacter sp. CY261]|uniref:BACON domain-containing protein n=1 Tax=Dyadobacter sp. CY261 TaxID=2907203 RepID=UPI001F36D070|nr:BACON domain-containing carbohydrate-binding protein [Dyadobacter sp. CY261]MCF0074947.1 T9SS type A sorting domain-containing protein [Dyadobacter sp. CY261]
MKNFYQTLRLSLFLIFFHQAATAQTEIFNYKDIIRKASATTLALFVQNINLNTGDVTITGGDSRAPGTPFTFIWGDNLISQGFFPTSHKYADFSKNYILKVVGNYSDNSKDTVAILVSFTKPAINKITLDPFAKVTVPSQTIPLSTHFSIPAPQSLTAFSDEMFTGQFNRGDLEYLLSIVGSIETEFMNSDLYLYENKFQQYLFRDAGAGGGYAIWYTDPVAMAAGDALVNTTIDFSSLAHEMGHNFTLNTPAKYIFGGKIDGSANACYSESMAQIFQHATGYELINNYKKYGLDQNIYLTLVGNFKASFNTLKNFYLKYLEGGKKFTTWNDPSTANDETLLSFATTAFKFCEYAENEGQGYTMPVKRMMQFLQKFNAEWHQRFDQFNNTEAANSFRATMMVAALSHAFQKDLRQDFRSLNYPISDSDWAFLNPKIETLDVSTATLQIGAANASAGTFTVTSNAAWSASSSQAWLTVTPLSGSGNQTITATATANTSSEPRTAIITLSVNGSARKTVNITQTAMAPSLSVSTKNLTVSYAEGSKTTFDIQSNAAWTVASSQTWATVNPDSGNQNATITVTAIANPLFENRKATITVKALGIADQLIELVQTAPPITGLFPKHELTVFPNPVTDYLEITGPATTVKVEILNMLGQSIQIVEPARKVPVRHLKAGLYLIRITSGNKSSIIKIVKI